MRKPLIKVNQLRSEQRRILYKCSKKDRYRWQSYTHECYSPWKDRFFDKVIKSKLKKEIENKIGTEQTRFYTRKSVKIQDMPVIRNSVKSSRLIQQINQTRICEIAKHFRKIKTLQK